MRALPIRTNTGSSPGGIWILVGSCVEAVCGSRGATVTVCGAAPLGTVITTVLPGVAVWFMEAPWLKGGFVTCCWPLALTPPGVATFDTTRTEGEDIWSPGTGTVEEIDWWPWPVGMTLVGAETESTFETPAAVGGGWTAVTDPHWAGTCNILTWVQGSPSPADPQDSSFWASRATLLVAIVHSERKNSVMLRVIQTCEMPFVSQLREADVVLNSIEKMWHLKLHPIKTQTHTDTCLVERDSVSSSTVSPEVFTFFQHFQHSSFSCTSDISRFPSVLREG